MFKKLISVVVASLMTLSVFTYMPARYYEVNAQGNGLGATSIPGGWGKISCGSAGVSAGGEGICVTISNNTLRTPIPNGADLETIKNTIYNEYSNHYPEGAPNDFLYLLNNKPSYPLLVNGANGTFNWYGGNERVTTPVSYGGGSLNVHPLQAKLETYYNNTDSLQSEGWKAIAESMTNAEAKSIWSALIGGGTTHNPWSNVNGFLNAPNDTAAAWAQYLELLISVWRMADGTDLQVDFGARISDYLSCSTDELSSRPVIINIETFFTYDGAGGNKYIVNTIDALNNYYGADNALIRSNALDVQNKWDAHEIAQKVYTQRTVDKPPVAINNKPGPNTPSLSYGAANAFKDVYRDYPQTGSLRVTNVAATSHNAQNQLNYKEGYKMYGLNQIICKAIIPATKKPLRQDITPNSLTIEEPTGKIAKSDTVVFEAIQGDNAVKEWTMKNFTTTKAKITVTGTPSAQITSAIGRINEFDISKDELLSLFKGATKYSYDVANAGVKCPVTYNFTSTLEVLDPASNAWIVAKPDDGKAKIIHTFKGLKVPPDMNNGMSTDYDFYYAMSPAAFGEMKEAGDLNKVIYSEKWEAMAGVPTTQYIYFGVGGSAFVCELTGKYHKRVDTTRHYQTSASATDDYNYLPGQKFQQDCLDDGDTAHCYMMVSWNWTETWQVWVSGYMTTDANGVEHNYPGYWTSESETLDSGTAGPFGYRAQAQACVEAHSIPPGASHGGTVSGGAYSTSIHNTNGTDSDGHESCDQRSVSISRDWKQKIVYDYMELTNVNVWQVKNAEATGMGDYLEKDDIQIEVGKDTIQADYYHGGGALKASGGRINWGDSQKWKDDKTDGYGDNVYEHDDIGAGGIEGALEENPVSFDGYADWKTGTYQSKVNETGWLNAMEHWMDKCATHDEKVKPTIISDYVFIKTDKGTQPLFWFTQTAEKSYRTWNAVGSDVDNETENDPSTWDDAYGDGSTIVMKEVSKEDMWAQGISYIQDGYDTANRLSYNGTQDGATMDQCSQTKFEGKTITNKPADESIVGGQPDRKQSGTIATECRWFSEPMKIKETTPNGEKLPKSAKIYYSKMPFSWGAGPTYNGDDVVSKDCEYAPYSGKINSIVIHDPVSSEYAIISSEGMEGLDQRASGNMIVTSPGSGIESATKGLTKNLKSDYNQNLLYNTTGSLQGLNDIPEGWVVNGDTSNAIGNSTKNPSFQLKYTKGSIGNSTISLAQKVGCVKGGDTYVFKALSNTSSSNAKIRLRFLPSNTVVESNVGNGQLTCEGKSSAGDTSVSAELVLEGSNILIGECAFFTGVSLIDKSAPGTIPDTWKIEVDEPEINPAYHSHLESGCDYTVAYQCHDEPKNAGEGTLVWDCTPDKRTEPNAPYHYTYTEHVHTPDCAVAYTYACGKEDNSATTSKFLGTTTKVQKDVKYSPPAEAYTTNISPLESITPMAVTLPDGTKINGATYLVLDKQFKLYYPLIGNFPQQVPFGLANSTENKGHSFTEEMDLKPYTDYKYVIFPFPVVFKGEYIQENEIIKLDKDVDVFNFTIPIAANEMSKADIELGSVAINSPTKLPETASKINNYERPDTPLAAKHASKRNQILDVIGRIGNGTIMDCADMRYSNFFKKATSSGIVGSVVKKVIGNNQQNYLGDSIDILGLNSIDSPFHLNTYGRYPYKGNTAPVYPMLLPSQLKSSETSFSGQQMRIGYKVFQDVETIGNYHNGFVQVVPYFYALEKSTGKVQPVDIYDYQDKKYVPINLYDNYKAGYNADSIYSESVYLDWANEFERRMVSAEETKLTNNVCNQYFETTEDGSMSAMDQPRGGMYCYGDYQHLLLTTRNRTFMGNNKTYEESRDPNGVVSSTEPNIFNLHGQRWHFSTGLPSSAVIVPKGTLPTTDNKVKFDDGKYSLITAIKAYAVGDVWTLEYNLPNPNNIKVYSDNEPTHPTTYTFPPDEVPAHIVSITSISKSAKDDITQVGTH